MSRNKILKAIVKRFIIKFMSEYHIFCIVTDFSFEPFNRNLLATLVRIANGNLLQKVLTSLLSFFFILISIQSTFSPFYTSH